MKPKHSGANDTGIWNATFEFSIHDPIVIGKHGKLKIILASNLYFTTFVVSKFTKGSPNCRYRAFFMPQKIRGVTFPSIAGSPERLCIALRGL